MKKSFSILLRLILLSTISIVVTITFLFLFHENGFETRPHSLTIYSDNYLISVLIMSLYALLFIGWIYLVMTIILHVVTSKFKLKGWSRYAMGLILGYFPFYIFYQMDGKHQDVLILGTLVFGCTSLTTVLTYNLIFKEKR